MKLQNNGKRNRDEDDVILLCPKCEPPSAGQHLGVTAVETDRSDDTRYLTVRLIFKGECEHQWTTALDIHKGTTEVQSF